MKKLYPIFFYLLSFTIFFTACDDDNDSVNPSGSSRVVVINEGNFNSADGSLSTYNPTDGTVNLTVFANQNGFPIGATVQNMSAHQGLWYAITANPDKVEVISPSNFGSIATIDAGTAQIPALENAFGFAAVGNKGYVSNWGTFNDSTFIFENSFIAVLNLDNNTVTQRIDLNEQPQHLLAVNDQIYIANVSSNTLFVLNPNTDLIEDTIVVENGPDQMLLDANQKIWVICRSGSLVRVDPSDHSVEATVTGIQTTGFNEKMAINGSGDKIYYLSSTGFDPSTDEIYEFEISATTAPTTPLISGQNLYGVGIDPLENIIYVSDAAAFQDDGTVTRYDTDGNALNTFDAGRGPNGFLFQP